MNDLVPTNSNQLVPVFTAKIGDANTQACDARALHAYLKNGDLFANWIKARIAKYQFQENVDYSIALVDSKANENRGGQNRKDYHITLDMAKELAMLENNAKGREARQYFIAMEKQALQQTAIPPLVAFIGQETRAVSALESHLKAAALFACPLHLAQTEAVKAVRDSYAIDFSPLLLSAPAQQNIPKSAVMLEPTELGKLFGLSAREMNAVLEHVGLRVKTKGGWEPTDAGIPMCVRHHWSQGGKSGYNLKWNVDLVESAVNTQH